jgi:hypothetical protein
MKESDDKRRMVVIGETLLDMAEVKMLRPCELDYPGVYVHLRGGTGFPVAAKQPKDSEAARAWILAGCPIPESPDGAPFNVTAWHEGRTARE